MNTSKQVNAMIGLLFLSFLVFGVYVVNEGKRAEGARFSQDALLADRGAALFVNNCRSCHGLHGLGPEEGGIGPKLNSAAFLILGEDNPFGLEPTPEGEAQGIEDFLHYTIACGRTNTAMPAWSEKYGGPLSDVDPVPPRVDDIGYIVKMITQGRWDLVEHHGEEHDAAVKAQNAEAIARFNKPYVDLAKPTEATKASRVTTETEAVDQAITAGTATRYEQLTPQQKTAVDNAVKKTILADPTTLSVTTRNCGQYTGAAATTFRERNAFSGAAAAPAAGASPAATQTGGGADQGPADATVNATMSEMKIDLASREAAAGRIRFAVRNSGVLPHEFVVVKSDAASGALPQRAGAADLSGQQVIGRVAEFPGNETRNGTFAMQAGKYVVLCNIVGHYAAGMHAGFEVK